MFKRIFIAIVCTCPLLVFAQAQIASHVVLISIDGFHPDMYEDSTWPAPNLRELMKRGTYADHMLSVFPAYTYPSHTAMLTGALPARSKINFNQPIGSQGEWFWFASAVKMPTLWQALKAQGLTTAAVEWPVSVTPDITWDMPEIWAVGHPEDRISEARKYATPGLIDDVERYATGHLDSSNFNDRYYSLDENAGRAASYIFLSRKPALLAVHFATVDGFEHEEGRDGDSVRLAVETVDRAIGDILETISKSGLRDSTAVLIVGDHGFANIHTVCRVNMLLKGIPAMFVASGGSAFLYRFRTSPRSDEPGIIQAVTAALDSLPRDQRGMFRIIDRKELNLMGADSAVLMALSAQPGLVFSGVVATTPTSNQGPGTSNQQNNLDGVFLPTHGGHHGYDPNIPEMYTGFIAAGAGIVKAGHIRTLCVTDIAPLVAQLLGVEFVCPDGKLVPGIVR
jgi:arylsulfatase A-like enzyme